MREPDMKLSVRILKLRYRDDKFKMVRGYLAEKVTFSGRFSHNE